MLNHHTHLLLASASPRRRQIITSLGLPYTIGVSPTDEEAVQALYRGPADGLAQWTAAHKTLGALTMPESQGALVVAADTTVLLDDQILGKPRDAEHARQLLRSLRGRWHRVVTGVIVCALKDGQITMFGASQATPVLMRPYSDAEIDAYIASGDPMDKAGAYGIQNPDFQPTERIDGCYLNVVGLPLGTLTELLARFDVQPLAPHVADPACPCCPWSTRLLKNEATHV
ncbi:Maf family protein [Ktedonobacter robiniae]|uniref:dTTP/UTP pyrophosphatase n=1 Tax=Ktedonobacter robiniae TaxID=2778365 RepID=A0ABQ3UPQ5_9CHLR|nr:Maf family protein [Ktedonobacter robiniae]GHO54714.1 Maf-like protein [Ktedonobacter robiniae]